MKAILTAAATSADIFAVAAGMCASGIKLPLHSAAAVAFTGAAALWLSAVIFSSANVLFPTAILIYISKSVLLIMGIRTIFGDFFKKKKNTLSYSNAMSDPACADVDNSHRLSLWEGIGLGAALSADSVFTGISVGIAGLDPNIIFLLSFIFGLTAILTGSIAGKALTRFTGKAFPAGRIGGVILIILAILL